MAAMRLLLGQSGGKNENKNNNFLIYWFVNTCTAVCVCYKKYFPDAVPECFGWMSTGELSLLVTPPFEAGCKFSEGLAAPSSAAELFS
ncbi:hypothetical protein F6476_22595 [Pseudomonas umsongensis]|uniref:hypothetical protein n=1 Tax=Pseudomonas umsongensis TaxID=198618 RepID=UPI001248272C|nr:hypothetical protein [Pseudomonas umsongensis]QFG31762.1 hypothetical protein F6476_22595 [Pseudomonas umsongensis]